MSRLLRIAGVCRHSPNISVFLDGWKPISGSSFRNRCRSKSERGYIVIVDAFEFSKKFVSYLLFNRLIYYKGTCSPGLVDVIVLNLDDYIKSYVLIIENENKVDVWIWF